MQHPNHRVTADTKDRARHDGRRGPNSGPLTRQASFAKEVSRPKHCEHGISSGLRLDGQLDSAGLNVHNVFGGVSLREDDIALRMSRGAPATAAKSGKARTSNPRPLRA